MFNLKDIPLDYPEEVLALKRDLREEKVDKEIDKISPQDGFSNLVLILILISSAVLTFTVIVLCAFYIISRKMKRETARIRKISEMTQNSRIGSLEKRKSHADSLLDPDSKRLSFVSRESTNPNQITILLKNENKPLQNSSSIEIQR